jgi:catechol 2,3-dioxygenase-like lactoylglutathione lyase family enzyme
LEIFSYNRFEDRPPTAVNRPGLGHIAFQVDDVLAAHQAVIAAGGRPVGQIVTLTIANGARVTWCYVTDPEGNVIELQAWSAPEMTSS